MTESTIRRLPQPTLEGDELAALLALDISATLAFVDADGFPRLVPCWFLYRDEQFHVSSLRDKFHVRCLQRNPRASICVEQEVIAAGRFRRNRQAKAVGTVDIVDDPDGRYTREIRAKYLLASQLGTASTMSNDTEPRVILRLTPKRLTAHGGKIERTAATS
ncbi:MAG: pyridoxamine 5'-phosphate oxidase family protein [Pseudomonadota bacterium]